VGKVLGSSNKSALNPLRGNAKVEMITSTSSKGEHLFMGWSCF
jgi:hypothetical protein